MDSLMFYLTHGVMAISAFAILFPNKTQLYKAKTFCLQKGQRLISPTYKLKAIYRFLANYSSPIIY